MFTDMFQRQKTTLENIKEEEGADDRVHVQVIFI